MFAQTFFMLFFREIQMQSWLTMNIMITFWGQDMLWMGQDCWWISMGWLMLMKKLKLDIFLGKIWTKWCKEIFIGLNRINKIDKLFTYFARKYFTLDLKIWMLKTTQKTSQVSKHFWIEQDFQCKKFCQAIKAWVQCLRQKVICLSHPIGNLLQEKINIIEEVISLKSMAQGTEVKLMQFKQNFQSP